MNSETITAILLIEDNPGDARLVREMLHEHHSDSIRLTTVQSMADAERDLGSTTFDIILLDLGLPDTSGSEAVRRARRAAPHTPLVVLSGLDDEAVAVRSLQEGAQDYLLKGQTQQAWLLRSLRFAIERNISQVALRKSEERFRQITDSIRDVFFITNFDSTHMYYVSPAYETIWGRSCASLYQDPKSWAEAIHPDDRPHVVKEFMETARTGFSYDYRVVRPDGEMRWVQVRSFPIVNKDGVPYRTAGIVTDVTDRKGTEHALNEANNRYQRVVRAANVGLWEWHLSSKSLYISPEAKQQIGLAADALSGRYDQWTERLHPDDKDRALKYLREYVRNPHGPYVQEYRLAHKDGSYRWFLAIGDAELGAEGETLRLLGAHVDITERRRLEELFRQSQKMESVGRLAGGIAHDFNNLLCVILGYAEFALQNLRESDPLKKDLTHIHHAGEKAAALTRQLLAFSRKQVMHATVLNLNTVAADVEGILQRVIGEDIALTFIGAPDLGNVMADSVQIEQVIMNLAVNARDAMPAGGHFTIETKNVELDESFAEQHQEIEPGSYVLLAFSDTGTGIDPIEIENIFDPFYTTKELGKGTGLGLATVHGIVKQSGGYIRVYSEIDRGSTFRIYLPRIEEHARPVGKTHLDIDLRGDETVLLVEDDSNLRELTERILTWAGYDVLTAASGGEALLLMEKRGAPVHIMLSDVVMPGISGPELAERLAEVGARPRVLYMSGYTDNAIMRNGMIAETDAFLGKPFTPSDLLRRMREVLDMDMDMEVEE
jgi:PAS domain S-box-containing protein